MTSSTPSEALAEEELLAFINDTPVVLSLLYDLDLMPEQAKKGSLQRDQMLLIAAHFKEALRAGPPEGPKCEDCGFGMVKGDLDRSGQELWCQVCAKAGIRLAENKRLREELAKVQHEGMVLVPREPTLAMAHAFLDHAMSGIHNPDGTVFKGAYRAMLAAASSGGKP